MLTRTQVQQALDAGGGLLRLEPSWIHRVFMVPGRRLKLLRITGTRATK